MTSASKTFNPSTTLYSGQPTTPTTARCGRHCPNAGNCVANGDTGVKGTYNGGGRGSKGGSGGGSATDVRMVVGELQTRMLVAAGGGPVAVCSSGNCDLPGGAGGRGGGLAGADGDQRAIQKGLGATQDAGGAATSPVAHLSNNECGADYYDCQNSGGGGGGWYGGGSGGGSNDPGGGGSSYYDGMDADKHTQPGVNAGAGYATDTFK
jgi:hypothetical protein